MVGPKELPLIAEPLDVHVVENEIVVGGSLPVPLVLTPTAAIETGVRLINAGMAIGTEFG